MKYIVHKPNPERKFKIAILIKELSFNKKEIEKYYVQPLVDRGHRANDIITISLKYKQDNTCPVSFAKKYLNNLQKQIEALGNPTLLVPDSAYFKILTKERKADPHFGYVKRCRLAGWEKVNCVLSVNFSGLIYNPANKSKLDMSIDTISEHLLGFHEEPGTGIIVDGRYPDTIPAIQAEIIKLYKKPALTVDIETYGLSINRGICSIGFAWNKHCGVSFHIGALQPEDVLDIQGLLKFFFETYTGKLIYHGGTFDIKHLIHWLFMDGFLDYEGMINGLEIMTRNIEDTMIMTYLATNTTAENKLDLKSNAHEFAGNYAVEEIGDLHQVPPEEVVEYNLVDCLCTWHLVEKYYPTVAEEQEEIYREIFLPSMKVVIQMELVGMPLDINTTSQLGEQLTRDLESFTKNILSTKEVQEFTSVLQMEALITKNASLKRIQKTLDDFKSIKFNPNSNSQVGRLLHEKLQLPIIDTTPKGQPQVGTATLKKLLKHSTTKIQKYILGNLIHIQEASIIKNTFINAFLTNSIHKSNGFYLHGGFNICGTKSGRMSSSKPNLQNIPSTGTKYAKPIKECFKAPPGWIMIGADFSSLEDRISALTTKDPNKLKVYTDGYDGHSLRAYAYFGDQMPDIINTVESINSIQTNYPELRQKSKGPTFALTYQGTAHALVNNIGLEWDEAVKIETSYHELYEVSDQWVEDKLEEASKKGYVSCAFGLKLRTPLLKQVLQKKSSTPYQAQAEGRTAGNALGQSWGLLNNRSGIEIQDRIHKSKYRLDIMPICQIHDSQYFMVRNKVGPVHWLNENLIETMQWQDHPDIQHPDVGLGGELAIYWPTWAHEITIPNNASKQEIYRICHQIQAELAHPS